MPFLSRLHREGKGWLFRGKYGAPEEEGLNSGWAEARGVYCRWSGEYQEYRSGFRKATFEIAAAHYFGHNFCGLPFSCR